jgi:hypothetical protein
MKPCCKKAIRKERERMAKKILDMYMANEIGHKLEGIMTDMFPRLKTLKRERKK